MIVLNGDAVALQQGASLLDALARIGVDMGTTGVAVAVDGEVVPRTHWAAYALHEGARIEALTAMQGG